MKHKVFYISLGIIILFLALIYFPWFSHKYIIGGDWPFFFDEHIAKENLIVPAWSELQGNGLGGINPVYFLQMFQNTTFFLTILSHIPWFIVYRITWFLLFLVLGFYSSYVLGKEFLKNSPKQFQFLPPLIFLTNTYILMVVSGGQMGVALAYSIAPLILIKFIRLMHAILEKRSREQMLFHSFVTSAVLAIQVMLDPRIVYITLCAVLLYYLFAFSSVFFRFKEKDSMNIILTSFLFVGIIPAVLVILLHAVWIIPTFLVKEKLLSQLGDAFTTTGIVKFLSFADFSHAFSLLHPNWPENIFGKTYFLRPEFLILPFLAFTSLLFIKKNLQQKDERILFLSLLGLCGVFLAKGANNPFGILYEWFFLHIPGFVLFRDPTKWFLLIIISYSLLIPLTLSFITGLQRKTFKKNYFPVILFVLFLFFWGFTIRDGLFGRLPGTFQNHTVPEEYISLKNKISSDTSFYRTLWVPRQSRFALAVPNHPSVDAMLLFNATDSAEIVRQLKDPYTPTYLSHLAIKYLIIPYDSLGEIFLDDRKYSEKERIQIERMLDTVPYLRKIQDGKLTIYELPDPKGHFFMKDKTSVILSTSGNATTYHLLINTSRPDDLVFSENFSANWVAQIGNTIIPSLKTGDNLNTFPILTPGRNDVTIYYTPQKFYDIGGFVSLITLGIVSISLGILYYRKRKKS